MTYNKLLEISSVTKSSWCKKISACCANIAFQKLRLPLRFQRLSRSCLYQALIFLVFYWQAINFCFHRSHHCGLFYNCQWLTASTKENTTLRGTYLELPF